MNGRASEQQSVDVICISGNFFDDSINAALSLSEQATWYRQFLMTLPVPIYICSGNHDIEDIAQDDVELMLTFCYLNAQ